jgi:hypothetical protein
MRLRWRLWWGLAESDGAFDFSCCEDVFIIDLVHEEMLNILYFQCDLERQWCNKLHLHSTQERFVLVKFDSSYWASK